MMVNIRRQVCLPMTHQQFWSISPMSNLEGPKKHLCNITNIHLIKVSFNVLWYVVIYKLRKFWKCGDICPWKLYVTHPKSLFLSFCYVSYVVIIYKLRRFWKCGDICPWKLHITHPKGLFLSFFYVS